MKEELGLDPLRGTILARRSPSCAYDYDRLRLPPASPARNSKAGKKESTGRRLSQLCPPYATPSSNSSLDYRRSDARIVENGFATSGGLSKSAKVVLGWVDTIVRDHNLANSCIMILINPAGPKNSSADPANSILGYHANTTFLRTP